MVAEGKDEVVRYLLSLGGASDPGDRWGNTPRDEAARAGFEHRVEGRIEEQLHERFD